MQIYHQDDESKTNDITQTKNDQNIICTQNLSKTIILDTKRIESNREYFATFKGCDSNNYHSYIHSLHEHFFHVYEGAFFVN